MNGDTAPALLEVRALAKRFGGLSVLAGLNVRVRAGETVAIVGPNGSGKSTTLSLIAGELQPDAGEIVFAGRSIARLPIRRRAELGIARTFQNGRVFGNMSVRENVAAGAFGRLRAARPLAALRDWPGLAWLALAAEVAQAVIGPPAVVAEARALDAQAVRELNRFGTRLLPRLDERAYLFSYANRRRIEIARALAARPALLLLDEPAAGMNTAETAELQAQLLELKAAGQTMLLVEHKLELVRALADRVIVLDGGSAIFAGSAAAFQTDPAVLAAYVGPTIAATATTSAPPTESKGAPAGPPAEVPPLLELRAVDAAYGAFNALSAVSLTVGDGEIVSLLGGNASGKSTTMKIVLGLKTPTAGSVAFGARDITRARTSARIRSGIGSVPEARRIFPLMTVEENLRVGAFVRAGAPTRDDFERVFALFPRLAERRTQAAGTLSGGEQQMLAIGRALMSRPRLLCLDEPTMGLAPQLVERVLGALVEINRTGTSILMVEQNVALALQIARRGYVLAGGRIIAAGMAAELKDSALVREAFLGTAN